MQKGFNFDSSEKSSPSFRRKEILMTHIRYDKIEDKRKEKVKEKEKRKERKQDKTFS